jgi:hypothetical protein
MPAGGSPTTTDPGPMTATRTGACTSSDFDYSTSTNTTTYGRSQPVVISFVVHNHSDHPCDGPSVCGVVTGASVLNNKGKVVWRGSGPATMCSNPSPPPPRLNPGQSATYGAGNWSQTICTSNNCSGQLAPAGGYRAVARQGNTTAAGTSFTLTG